MDEATALSSEFERGRGAITEAKIGAQRFTDGAGRHGTYEEKK